jgi:hypothetical protein
MFRRLIATGLATLVIGAAALTGASLATTSPARAYDGYHGRGYERPHHWRPAPPAFHGYWGHRRWQRYNEGHRFRAPPPRYGHGYGWR